jgi:hypothetical protein
MDLYGSDHGLPKGQEPRIETVRERLGDRDHAQSHLGQAELGGGVGDDHVAHQCDSGPAAKGNAANRRDHRFAQRGDLIHINGQGVQVGGLELLVRDPF